MYTTTHNTTERTMELYFGNGHRILVDFNTNILTVCRYTHVLYTVGIQGLSTSDFMAMIAAYEIEFQKEFAQE